jgi:hypothetical protein
VSDQKANEEQPHEPAPFDRLAMENEGFWDGKLYYVAGLPLYTVDENDVPVPLDEDFIIP